MKKINKTMRLAWLAVAAIAGLGACSNIDYEGEYSKDGFYHADNQVYFYYATAADTLLNYSFGGKVNDTISHTVYVPVRLAGRLQDKAQSFKVEVDPSSTAKSDVHFKALADQYVMEPNAAIAYVPVELLRSELSEVKNDSIKLVLRLVATPELGVRFSQSNTIAITFDNVLVRPDFWSSLETLGMGAYAPAKHKRLLNYYDGDVSKIYKALTGDPLEDFYALYYHIIEIENYFKAHPEEL